MGAGRGVGGGCREGVDDRGLVGEREWVGSERGRGRERASEREEVLWESARRCVAACVIRWTQPTLETRLMQVGTRHAIQESEIDVYRY